jgi:hypothetical protein
LPGGSHRFKLVISLSEDLLIPAGQLVGGCDVSESAVETHFAVAADVAIDQASGGVHGEWSAGPNALRFECAVSALDLAIALWVIRRCSHMRPAGDPDELLEVTSAELRTIVADDPGMHVGVPPAGTLDDRFDVGLSHVGSNLPVHDGTAEAVEQAAEEEKCPANVHIGKVDVPVLVWG